MGGQGLDCAVRLLNRWRLVLFPGLAMFLLLLSSRSCVGDDLPAVSGYPSLLPCPTTCVHLANVCGTVLRDANCENNLKCCLDEQMTTAISTVVTTVENTSKIESISIPKETYDIEGTNFRIHELNAKAISNQHLQDFDVSAELSSGFENLDDGNCPGVCVLSQYAQLCKNVMHSDGICTPGTICCISEKEEKTFANRADYEEIESTSFFRRISGVSNEGKVACPFTCVSPLYLSSCEEVLDELQCSSDAKCCRTRSDNQNIARNPSVLECTGLCLSSHLYNYCVPPNDLVTDLTTCALGTTCCMRSRARTRDKEVRRQAFRKEGFPVSTNKKQFAGSVRNSNYRGHIVTDDEGNAFRIAPNGQIFPLPRLTSQDHLRNAFSNVKKFIHPNGRVFIFADSNGLLYQQFYPRPQNVQQILLNGASSPGRPPPQLFVTHSQSGMKLDAQSADNLSKFYASSSVMDVPGIRTSLVPDTSSILKPNSEKSLTPDDKDKVPASTSTQLPLVDRKLAKPPCTGSCMSHFLRFTCFRGYAIYDGFSCPGRSVCCAKLKDIEDHEEYLKSLSPYFNPPPALRDTDVPRCGLKGRRDTPRLLGGKDALPGEWCWQVALINTQNQYICGGSLIDNSWVLTAAHCVIGPMRENQALYIRAGVTDLKSPEDNSAGQTIGVLSTFIHYNFNSVNLDNDIALLRLEKPVELGKNACIICLPTAGHMPKENTKCTVTGYGSVSKDGAMLLKTREARVPLVQDEDCVTNVTDALDTPFVLPARSFCAGGHGQEDVCQGDAGGPLACEVSGYYELIGLVSWGLGCGRQDVPSIYVKVPSFMGWINQIISSSSFLASLN